MQSNVLNLLYAQLELDYEYIRAVTPFYSIYEVVFRNEDSQQKVMADNTQYAKIVRQWWRMKGSGYQASLSLLPCSHI